MCALALCSGVVLAKLTPAELVKKQCRSVHLGYSFIEDFRRNYESAKIQRVAKFQNGWVLGVDGTWSRMSKARFTGDVTPSTNIDAGAEGDGFFLMTGGETTMKTTKLWSWMENKSAKSTMPETVAGLVGK